MIPAHRLFAVVALCTASLTASVQAQTESAVVAVTGGTIRGSIEDGQAVFRGVPYAAPPVGAFRWREPQPVRPWTGTREAVAFGESCVQGNGRGGREDCLTLNVWTPDWPRTSPKAVPKAVMVWFHGGGNTQGGANAPLYYGASLARRGVVVVTAQYRLGVLGFFAHPELTQESPHHASGNYALLDQVAVLHWVRDNIAAFGGDPGNVTIFGESAGAENVGLLLVSPLAKGLFHKAIAQSGPLRKIYPALTEQERQCGMLARVLGAPPGNDLSFLRKVAADRLMVAAAARPQECRPINIDGHVLTEQPLKMYAEGKQHRVPFMLGNNLREGFSAMTAAQLKETIATQYGEHAARAFALYGLDRSEAEAADPLYGDAAIQYGTDQAHRCRAVLTGLQHAATGQAFYQFQFSRNLPGRAPNSSTHADELAFVFGNPGLAEWGLTSAADNGLSEHMQAYWTNFAKTGDPNGPGLPAWRTFDSRLRSYMSFGEDGAVAGEGLRRAQCDLFLERETASPTWLNPERAPR